MQLYRETDWNAGVPDWSAGIPACNAAFFSGVKLRTHRNACAFSCFALMQARMPALQSKALRATLAAGRPVPLPSFTFTK